MRVSTAPVVTTDQVTFVCSVPAPVSNTTEWAPVVSAVGVPRASVPEDAAGLAHRSVPDPSTKQRTVEPPGPTYSILAVVRVVEAFGMPPVTSTAPVGRNDTVREVEFVSGYGAVVSAFLTSGAVGGVVSRVQVRVVSVALPLPAASEVRTVRVCDPSSSAGETVYGLVQAAKLPLSILHWWLSPPPLPPNVKVGVVSLSWPPADGPPVTVAVEVGATVS